MEAAHRSGIEVVALPGASSLLLALAASGLHGQSFAFVGYLPIDPPLAYNADSRVGGSVAPQPSNATDDRDAVP